MAEEPQPKPAGGRLPMCGLCLELAATDDAEQSPSAAARTRRKPLHPLHPLHPTSPPNWR